MESNRHLLLLGGIKSLLRCDDAEVVQGIANYVLSQHPVVRRMARFVEQNRNTWIPSVFALLGWLRVFLAVSPTRGVNGVAWLARLSNERRALEDLKTLAPELGWTELRLKSTPTLASTASLVGNLLGRSRSQTLPYKSIRTMRRILRIARLLHSRHEFFKVLRVVELIGYYMRYLEIFELGRFSLAVMSSHSNPHAIAFNLAARRFSVATVLITHGMPVRPVAKLYFNFAVVHCEAAQRIYLDEGCRIGRVLIHGRRQNYAPMRDEPLPENLTVGIFLCKDVNEQRLRALVHQLLGESRVARILVRPHPKNLWRELDEWIASQTSKVSRSRGDLRRDVEGSDIILGGNSSVLIDAVIAGRLSGYVSGLDHGPADLHELVLRGLIYPIGDDLRLGLDLDAMINFYRPPDWPNVLSFFANVIDDESSVMARAVSVMKELIATRSST